MNLVQNKVCNIFSNEISRMAIYQTHRLNDRFDCSLLKAKIIPLLDSSKSLILAIRGRRRDRCFIILFCRKGRSVERIRELPAFLFYFIHLVYASLYQSIWILPKEGTKSLEWSLPISLVVRNSYRLLLFFTSLVLK